MLDQTTINKLTRRGVAEIIPEQEFIARLQEGVPLRLKMGFDPSRPDIHLGHVVGLRKLRQLQELGHQVILIVGDWTAQIGDPSGQSATRPMLTHEQVVANAESYMRQFFKVVDRERTQVEWQSQWFGKFTLADVLRLTSRFTVAQILARDDFAKRFKENRPLAVTELLYPLLQAYDSVAIRADVEFGGTDQKFNLLVGRDLQGMVGQRPQQCFTVPLLVGTDGVQKMSKSLGNYIGVDEPPNDMYGKVMRLPDTLIVPYFDLLTDALDQEIRKMEQSIVAGEVNPMSLKKRLAYEITAQFHGEDGGAAAQAHFERVHQQRDVPEELPPFVISLHAPPERVSSLLVTSGLVTSGSEAKRLMSQGAVSLLQPGAEWEPVTSDRVELVFQDGSIIRVGKNKFRRVVRQ
ncbi:MAG: tyrosine--tRNA ligase [Chloroflexota bacterium]|nr:tyrosine--tRNA ligase [Chloroflexota bacterium]